MVKPIKPRRPRKVSLKEEFKARGASIIIWIIKAVLYVCAFVSGINILIYYGLIQFWALQGITSVVLTDLQTMILDYSITIFTGCAIFLLVYVHKFDEIVNRVLGIKKGVKKIKPIKKQKKIRKKKKTK